MKPTGLRKKVVIVTGAAAGIGRATALRFAEEGARVAAWDVNAAAAGNLVEQLESLGGEALFREVNVTSEESIQAGLEEVLERWSRVDVLVNNAGIVRDAQLVKFKDGAQTGMMTNEAFDSVLNVNLRGVFLCTRAVTPHMMGNGGGVVLNASSVVALYGNFGQTNYAATKAGLIAMTRTWARELGRYKIRVNAVAPGFIATEMVKAMPPKVLEQMAAHTPLGHLGCPEDIAETYVWLASEQARYVHGTVISVDGGLVLGT